MDDLRSCFRDKLLYNVDAEENYNLLEDIYETLNYDCGKFLLHVKRMKKNIGVKSTIQNNWK